MKKHTIIIAEAGVNHNGDMALAKRLIDVAAQAGVDYVKFQTFKAEKLVTREARKAAYQQQNTNDQSDTQFDMLKKLELSFDNHIELIDYCQQKNIRFLSTAFDEESIDLLYGLGIRLFKIPSGEITNLPYLRKIATLAHQVIISTGMAAMEDIEGALKVFTDAGMLKEQLTILHCNTEYPTPMVDVNLNAMQTIKDTFGVEVGYSDHTKGIEVPIAAVALGARVIEKHFTLDKTMEGPDHKASLEPDELVDMITAIRNIELALGNGIKQPSPSEQANMIIARKSLHVSKELKKGGILSADHITAKRPGDGISPMEIDRIIGKKVVKDLPVNHKLRASDFE